MRGLDLQLPHLNTPPPSDLPTHRHRYQREIFECSVCSHPINDGSERLFSRRHDAPKGEFRYECDQCQTFNLCEQCWDK